MNGRLYDPVLHRFLQPDNYVQDPFNTQNFNRYGYVLNNPLKYTDPSGEFLHIVIGAAIGGLVNWIANGAKFNAQGLAYFGIGAVSGALSTGIGSGVSSVLAGGSFGAGFLGTSSAMAATSSFISGAAIGGSAGFGGGFTLGAGNAWMKGSSFGEGLGIGLKDGLIGGLSGAAVGGIWSGIDAVRDGRNFWHGGRKVVDVNLSIPQVDQIGQYDCNYACAESVDSYYGNGRNQSYFQSLEPGKTGKGLTDVEIGRMYGKSGYVPKEILIKNRKPIEIINDIADVMNANKAIILNYKTGVSGVINSAGQKIMFGHATVINRIRIFDNGKFIINVMNPGGSLTRFINIKQFHRIIAIN